MQRIILALALLVVSFSTDHLSPAFCQEQQKEAVWEGRLADGTVITEEDLKKILADHKEWMECIKEDGKDACKNLGKADLNHADLRRAPLSGANLSGANLRRANLSQANLNGANLSGADLYRAYLAATFLNGAVLNEANLNRAKLIGGAQMTEAQLVGAKLIGASLVEANLSNAYLRDAKLIEANLVGAYLYGANLMGANLTRANLNSARLGNARLYSTILRKANLWGANLESAVFEPRRGKLPDISQIAGAKHLSDVIFSHSPEALEELRRTFEQGGYTQQAREITYAINRSKRILFLKKDNLLDKLEGTFNYIAFEITCQYGMSPRRALISLLCLIVLSSIPYALFFGRRGKDGIWQVWTTDRIRSDLGRKKPVRLRPHGFHLIAYALYFSLLSAFSIGWRELNVGNWISRMQRKEYTLRATGWARTISGVQSLTSVYLLALWVLTYFGKLFQD